MVNRTYRVRIRKLTEQGSETDLQETTATDRLEMMWQLALNAWAFKGEPVAQSRLPRHVVRILRPKS